MNDLASLLHETLSGEDAQGITGSICEYYRSPGAAGYHAVTTMVGNLLRTYGVEQIEETTHPLDGKTTLLDRLMPYAWEPYDAKVQIMNPVQEPLVDFATAPSCLAWWSKPTPPGGMTAEVVDVGTGESPEDYAGKELQGKIAFISGTERPAGWSYAATQCMERGAAGILTDYLFYPSPPHRTRENLPQAVQLLRLPNQAGEYDAWACALSYTAAQRLRRVLKLGPVTVHAGIQCRLFEGQGRNLVATIPGRELPEESVFFISHCSAGTRPCANCAAGPALMVTIARTLTHLIKEGKIRAPRRSIKFLFLAEGLGSHAYIAANRDEMQRIKAAFCFDSVGHHQEKLKSSLLFYRHPDSSPSYINDYFESVMESAPKDGSWVFRNDHDLSPVRFEQAPYTPWSDNHVWAAFGVPSPLIMSWPDLYFHTQLLTADNTDPRVFRRAGVTTALAAYEIANADPIKTMAITDEVATRNLYRLDAIANRAIQRIGRLTSSNGDSLPETEQIGARAKREIAYTARQGARAVESTLTLSPSNTQNQDEPLRRRVAEYQDQLQAKARASIERLDTILDAAQQV